MALVNNATNTAWSAGTLLTADEVWQSRDDPFRHGHDDLAGRSAGLIDFGADGDRQTGDRQVEDLVLRVDVLVVEGDQGHRPRGGTGARPAISLGSGSKTRSP